MRILRILLCFVLSLGIVVCHSSELNFNQKRSIDSLKLVIEKSSIVRQNITASLAIAEIYYDNNNYKLATTYAKKALKESSRMHDTQLETRSATLISNCFDRRALLDSALLFNSICIRNYTREKDTTRIVQAYCVSAEIMKTANMTRMAHAYVDSCLIFIKVSDSLSDNRGNFAWTKASMLLEDEKVGEALMLYLEAAKIYRHLGDTNHFGGAIGNAAMCYEAIEDYKRAEHYYKESINICKQIGNRGYLINSYGNLSMVLKSTKQYDSAAYYLDIAISISKELEQEFMIIIGYNVKAELYRAYYEDSTTNVQSSDGNLNFIPYNKEALLDTAILYYQKAHKATKGSQYVRQYMTSCMGIAGGLFLRHHLKEAYQYYIEAEAIAIAHETLEEHWLIENELIRILEERAQSATDKSNFQESAICLAEALHRQQLLQSITDTIHAHQNILKVVRSEKKYELELKEQENLTAQKLIKTKAHAELSKLQYLLLSLCAIVIIVGIASWLLYRRYTVSREQSDLIASQKQTLDRSNKKILSSINYARTIQESILPKSLADVVEKSMILYLPKDIVSGDFYWSKKRDDCILIAVADCTGHGVPGGFMSMLGSTLLDKLTTGNDHIDPGQILNELSRQVNAKLGGKDGEMTDGMDMVLLKIQPDWKSLEFAGAKNSLVQIRQGEISEFKGERLSIGNLKRRPDYQTKQIPITQDDMLYLFSDGYMDQIGGHEDEKYYPGRFNDLLITTSTHPVQEQSELLASTFISWRGEHKQLDDVCIVGVKVK